MNKKNPRRDVKIYPKKPNGKFFFFDYNFGGGGRNVLSPFNGF